MWQQHLAGQLRNKKTLIGKHIRFKLSNIQNGWQLDAVGGFLDYNVWECTRYKTCIYIQYIYIYQFAILITLVPQLYNLRSVYTVFRIEEANQPRKFHSNF